MLYRSGKIEDTPAITKLISQGDYYLPTDAAAIGGHWVVAQTEDTGEIVGVVWYFAEPPQAHVDYYYVHPDYRNTMVAAKLLVRLQMEGKRIGVRFSRAMIRQGNEQAARMAIAMGMIVDPAYCLAVKEL